MIRNWLILAALGVFLGAILWVGTLSYRRERLRQYGEGHAIVYTLHDLSNIGWGLSTLWEMEHRSVELNVGGRLLSGTELFQLVSQSEDAMHYASISKLSLQRRSVCDCWGREVHAKLAMKIGSLHVMLWSDGLNQGNDSGGRDDLVVEIDIVTTNISVRTSEVNKL